MLCEPVILMKKTRILGGVFCLADTADLLSRVKDTSLFCTHFKLILVILAWNVKKTRGKQEVGCGSIGHNSIARRGGQQVAVYEYCTGFYGISF